MRVGGWGGKKGEGVVRGEGDYVGFRVFQVRGEGDRALDT